jgi:hypothetical protein
MILRGRRSAGTAAAFLRYRPRSDEHGRVAELTSRRRDHIDERTSDPGRSRNDHNHSDLSREVWILVFHNFKEAPAPVGA